MLKKLGLFHYLTFLAVLLAMVLIGLVLLRVPGPVRSAFVPPTAGPLATMAGGEVWFPSDTSGCEAFDLEREAWTATGLIEISPGDGRGPDCYAVPSYTEITITLEHWGWDDADVVRFFLDEDNLIGEVQGGDAVDHTYSITTMFPADMPPSILLIQAYHGDNPIGSAAPRILFIDKMVSTPAAPECQGFQLDSAPSIGYGELTISPSEEHGRRCYAIPADTEITLTWKNSGQCNVDSVSFNLDQSGQWDYIDAVCKRDGFDDVWSITTTFPADMPPSQLWIETWEGDQGGMSAPVIIFIER